MNEPIQAPQAAGSEAPGVLLVDDEPGILSALRRLLRPAGYRLFTAESGQAGLAVLEREAIALVVSDMRMPEMDGAAFLEQVRARWPGVIRILLTGYADVASTVAAINKGEIYRYIAKPWDDTDLQLIIRDALARQRLEQENRWLNELTQRQNAELKALNASLEAKVEARTAELRQTMDFLELAHKDLKAGFFNTVMAFGALQEMRCEALAGHSRRVADLCRAIAARLSLSDADSNDLFLAALLHDIGKIGLPDELLDKPFTALNPEARGLVVRHPLTAQGVLMAIEQLKGAAELIRMHHERFDGMGYPEGLSGYAIPLAARILAVANDYDALQQGTLVGRRCTAAEARAFLLENRGKRYDPDVVDAIDGYLAEIQTEEIQEIPLRVMHLQPGMVLTRDLMHPDGFLLLSRGRALDTFVIEQLKRLEERERRHFTAHVAKLLDRKPREAAR
jgi:response regulator RpfG family c-di-GMP phosphodiesterase